MTDGTDIIAALKRRGVRDTLQVSQLDVRYDCPLDSWIRGPYSDTLRDRYIKFGLVYREDKSDCNTFALVALSHARECHLLSSGRHQFAFGLLAYWSRKQQFHMANFYATHDDGELVVHAYEPQECRVVQLMEVEWRSTEWVLF